MKTKIETILKPRTAEHLFEMSFPFCDYLEGKDIDGFHSAACLLENDIEYLKSKVADYLSLDLGKDEKDEIETTYIQIKYFDSRHECAEVFVSFSISATYEVLKKLIATDAKLNAEDFSTLDDVALREKFGLLSEGEGALLDELRNAQSNLEKFKSMISLAVKEA